MAMTDSGVSTRLDRLEREVAELRRELELIRGDEESAPATEVAASSVTTAVVEAPPVQTPTSHREPASLTEAWRLLERNRADAALNLAFAVLAEARGSGDRTALDELDTFASVAVSATQGRTRSR